ncbi:aminoacyl-tRNA hydrolase [Phyllobacterium zundukense]|uniref:Peptidyl-tRNA hydrolase n=1 Tax=Phyllobacterium zundukense TaxID=1867719 RepID=A0A2N9VZD9_9HYPH|nr:aminoacyl-tRNA hydrolase [Phyllobacterium zundukense]ATU90890.1 aminoacyl-tRNA hydrolase [Phyllobacterium zundukense]PIO44857.1 aminoacyl-tRNA hydrolase [Phyllobacterium zundukense]
MLLIAGLGNPGSQYAANRHNIGFMAADEIHRRHSFSPWTRKFQALIADGTIEGEKTILIKPQTFMNLSGQAVGEAMRFYKLALSDLVVIYDELDLPSGKIRVKTGGGSGGHNGIKSIDAHCGKDYRRVRLGIGHPGVKEMVSNHVLGNFAKADNDWLEPLLDAIATNAALLVRKDDAGFMNRVSLALGNDGKTAGEPEEKPVAKPAGQSHIRQARSQKPAVTISKSGPMADMLNKLFGKKE